MWLTHKRRCDVLHDSLLVVWILSAPAGGVQGDRVSPDMAQTQEQIGVPAATGDRTRPHTVLWMLSAFCAAGSLAGLVLAALGLDERGTDVALQVTARFSFLLFWPAYAGGALATLFGPIFEPLKRRGREFGLAFASAHLIHIALVGWLIQIGAPPPWGTFVFFGIAVLWLYLLALFSIVRLQRMLRPKVWWLLHLIGLNYIAYAFATDFLRASPVDSLKHLIGYVPFAVLSVLGPALCLAAFVQRVAIKATERRERGRVHA